MEYYFSKTLQTDFDSAEKKTREALKEIGFGIISEINIQDKLKEKLDVDFQKYKILGACNPKFAYEALQNEDKIGTMLPCNVIVQEKPDGSIEVAAINPTASMMAIENPNLGSLAKNVEGMLKDFVEKL